MKNTICLVLADYSSGTITIYLKMLKVNTSLNVIPNLRKHRTIVPIMDPC